MRYLVAVLLLTSLLMASDRSWQDAVFLGQQTAKAGAIAMPIGTAVVAGPLTQQFFWFQIHDLKYCLSFPSRLSGRVPNLTVNGHSKVAIEGRRAHVLDDDGKDWKLTIVSKVAPKE